MRTSPVFSPLEIGDQLPQSVCVVFHQAQSLITRATKPATEPAIHVAVVEMQPPLARRIAACVASVWHPSSCNGLLLGEQDCNSDRGVSSVAFRDLFGIVGNPAPSAFPALRFDMRLSVVLGLGFFPFLRRAIAFICRVVGYALLLFIFIWHQPRSLFRRVGVRGGRGARHTAVVPTLA